MEYFLRVVKDHYADFNGRDTRQQYWMYILFYIIFAFALGVVGALIDTRILSVIYGLAMLIPNIGACTRRLHDTGRSGWWQLIGIIPLLGWIILIVFLVQDSNNTDNPYGSSSPTPSATA
jgi:uncharacterized membrane protein YhaH (DUF805 family)